MAWQLIYTSAPRGLVAGRSGFGTVARHREIRDGLVTAIERFSQYDRAGRAHGTLSPVVYAHRLVKLGGSSYHVLSCTADAGADYSGRTNHLAHHLICEPAELAQAPSPAEVLRQMRWLRAWTEAPRYLGAEEMIDLRRFHATATLPAQGWQALTGDAGCAALPLESGALAGSSWLYPAAAGDDYLLPYFAESLLLLDPAGGSPEKRWQVPFTCYLQATDQAGDFLWRGCRDDSPAAGSTAGARQSFDLTRPSTLRAPANPTAELARHGRAAVPAELSSAPAAPLAPPPPAAAAPAAKLEIDLAELLASADSNAPASPWAKAKSLAPGGQAHRVPGSAAPRQLPLKLIGLTFAAVLALGAGAIGFMSWRDGQAVDLGKRIGQARKAGNLAQASALAQSASRWIRNQDLLKEEIARTDVATELDHLKSQTPPKAEAYLTQNQTRLNAPALKSDAQINAQLSKLKRWIAIAQKIVQLQSRIARENLSAPGAVARELDDVDAAIAALEAPYRESVRAPLLQARQLFIERRLAQIEQTVKDGIPADSRALLALMNDAKRLGASQDIHNRIDSLYRPAATPPPKPEATQPAPKREPQAVAKNEGPAGARFGLPTIPTYIAADSASDVSGVPDFASQKKWQLFRTVEPRLQPSGEGETVTVEPTGKMYDASSQLLLTVQAAAITLETDRAKLHIPENFLLRAVEPVKGTPYQIAFCRASGPASLLTLPLEKSLKRNGDILTLQDDLAAALSLLKPAGANASYVAVRSGIRHPVDSWQAISFDLSLEIYVARDFVAKCKVSLNKMEATWNSYREITDARAQLLEKLNDFGLRLFRAYQKTEGKKGEKHEVPLVDKADPLAGIEAYLKRPSDTPKFDKTELLFEYLQAILYKLGALAPDRQKEIDERRTKLKEEWDHSMLNRRDEKMLKLWREIPNLAIKPPSGSDPKRKQPPLEVFCDTWAELFSKDNLPLLTSFFQGNGVDVVKPMAEAEAKIALLKAEAAKAETALANTAGKPTGSFSVELELRGPKPPATTRIVKVIEFLTQPGENPGGPK